jgi:hypothetical protein
LKPVLEPVQFCNRFLKPVRKTKPVFGKTGSNRFSRTGLPSLVLENILKKLNDIKEIEFHRLIADRQKSAYNKMIKNID